MNFFTQTSYKLLIGYIGLLFAAFGYANFVNAQSAYTFDDIDSLSAVIADFSEQRWSVTVSFNDGESDSLAVREVEDENDLFDKTAERVNDRYDMSISLGDVADSLVFDESDFDAPESDIKNIFAEPDKVINGRWELEVVDNDGTERVVYVYSIDDEDDLIQKTAGRLDLGQSTVRGLIDYDKALFDESTQESRLDDIIAAPDARVDYKWTVRVEYNGDGNNDSEFVLYGIFSTTQLHREIADQLSLELDEVKQQTEIKDTPFERVVVDEKETEDEEEEEEEKEKKEPVRLYKLSEISRVELIERGVDESGIEQYEIFVVTNDGSRFEGGGLVSRHQTDEMFYRDVARRINSRGHFAGFNDSNTKSKSVFTVDPLIAQERQEQKRAVEVLLVLVLEILHTRGDEQALEDIRELLETLD